MKNFTGKVTNVDNNGNPIKKKSTGKNGKKSGFKKPAAVKKSSGKKPLKDITAVMTKKPVRKIVEYYYFFNEEGKNEYIYNLYIPKQYNFPNNTEIIDIEKIIEQIKGNLPNQGVILND